MKHVVMVVPPRGEPIVILVALEEAADKGSLILTDGGMCRFHLRGDGVVTIREILVLPFHRRRGIARGMINRIREIHPAATLRAICPVRYESNRFWAALGFEKVAILENKCNRWECRPSASAPMEIASMPESR